MKTILMICALTLIAAGAAVWHATAKPARFGTFTGAQKAEVAEVIGKPAEFLHRTVEINGTVSEQCKSMGCYFFIRAGQQTLRVDLQEIAMHAPMREGHAARVEGQVVPYENGYQFYATAVEFE